MSKKPVMVWLHGGGFCCGSGDWRWNDGNHLAADNDVVIVSINHRLNVFGHLYLGELGDSRFAESGNVGLLDVVLALQWVRTNIHQFGGDPNNVTIFGNSGGGGKVIALMAMPAAQGLFHRAISQSGPYLRAIDREDAAATTRDFLSVLDLCPRSFHRLQQIPPDALLNAMNTVLKPEMSPDWLSDWKRWSLQFAPVVDSHVLPRHPFEPDAPEVSEHVPLLVGTTENELSSDNHSFNAKELFHRLSILGLSKEDSTRLVQEYRATRSEATPSDLFYAIATDRLCRMYVVKQAERKAAQGKAPVYVYSFGYKSQIFDGKFEAFHGTEVPFVFANLDRAQGLVGANPDPECIKLSRRMSAAWSSFARNGSPNTSGLSGWNPYTLPTRSTMILNNTCAVRDDPGKADRLAMESLFLKISAFARELPSGNQIQQSETGNLNF